MVKYQHIYSYENGQKRPVATVAVDGFSFGFAVCRNCDSFTKEMGRKIAHGRMELYTATPLNKIPRRFVTDASGNKVHIKDAILNTVGERQAYYFANILDEVPIPA